MMWQPAMSEWIHPCSRTDADEISAVKRMFLKCLIASDLATAIRVSSVWVLSGVSLQSVEWSDPENFQMAVGITFLSSTTWNRPWVFTHTSSISRIARILLAVGEFQVTLYWRHIFSVSETHFMTWVLTLLSWYSHTLQTVKIDSVSEFVWCSEVYCQSILSIRLLQAVNIFMVNWFMYENESFF